MPADTRRISILIDSNIFIALEDHGADGHVHGPEAAEFARLANSLGIELLLSHGTVRDTEQAEPERRARRQRALEKYVVLSAVPKVAVVEAEFPTPRTPNDSADAEVLNTFATGRARYLVTNDRKLRRRAVRAGYPGVKSLPEALDFLRSLSDPRTVHVPAVNEVGGYQVDLTAAIFDGLREDYPPFNQWWRDKASMRQVLILGSHADPEGVSVLKPEDSGHHPLQWPALKICTFKVKDEFQGGKRGELLLRATVDYARQHGHDRCYLEVYPHKTDMIVWLTRFGFSQVAGAQTSDGQIVMLKELHAPTGSTLSPLEHAIAYGPGSIQIDRLFALPIQDQWVTRLMPDVNGGDLFAGRDGSGNAIRKAYLCNASSNQLRPGDALAFIRTQAGSAHICALGTVEATLRSSDVDEIIDFVGSRTVYSRAEIQQKTRRPVLAILFRHFGPVESRILVRQMVKEGILNGAVQSLQQVRASGVPWIRQQLGV